MNLIKKALFATAPFALAFAAPAAAQDSQEDVMAMMSQMFPVEPLTEEEQARLPVSQEIIDKMIPPGTLGEMMGSMFDGIMQPIMEMASTAQAGDVAKLLGVESDQLEMSEEELAEAAQILDPVRDQRNSAISAVMPVMMGRVMEAMEPSMRKAMSEAYAITFTEQELADINAFFSTESGLNYARKSFTLSSDPRVIGASLEAMPAMMEIFGEMEAEMEVATASLPPERGFSDLSQAEISRLAELTGLSAQEIEASMTDGESAE